MRRWCWCGPLSLSVYLKNPSFSNSLSRDEVRCHDRAVDDPAQDCRDARSRVADLQHSDNFFRIDAALFEREIGLKMGP